MKRRTVSFGVAVCLVVSLLVCPCLSQRRSSRINRSPAQEQQRRLRDFQRRSEQRRLESQRRREEHRKISDEYRDEAHQEVLGVTAEQWAQMKPLIGRIDELRVGPMLKFSTYGFSSGGSSSSGGSVRSGSTGGSTGAGGGVSGGWSGASGGSSGGSSSYGFRTGSGPRPPRPGQGSAGGGSTGTGPEQPVKKRVGDLNLGWTWRRPSDDKGPDELTEGDKICEGLLDAIEAEESDPEAVKEHLEKLRQLRERAKRELEEARKQLREVVSPKQEAKLILMGYLD